MTDVYRIAHYDTAQQLGMLKQVLAENKRPIALLLAAGCPVSIRVDGKPLIPDVAGLTQAVIRTFADGPDTLLAGVLRHLSRSVENPSIEDILSYLRLLRQIPQGGSLHGVSDDRIRELEEDICEAIEREVLVELPHRGTPYHQVADWIRSTDRDRPVEIFTTNYDLLMEQALEETNAPFFDGFTGSRKPFFDIATIEADMLPGNWTRLWKLHGSIQWQIDESGRAITRGTPGRGCSLIHPSHLKYDQSRKMPYLVMMDRLKRFLMQPSAILITCGYSYRDQHINELVQQTLQANPTALAYGLQYGALESYAEARALALERSNFVLLARDRAIVGRKEGQWRQSADSGMPSAEASGVFTLGDFQTFAAFLADIVSGDGGRAL